MAPAKHVFQNIYYTVPKYYTKFREKFPADLANKTPAPLIELRNLFISNSKTLGHILVSCHFSVSMFASQFNDWTLFKFTAKQDV